MGQLLWMQDWRIHQTERWQGQKEHWEREGSLEQTEQLLWIRVQRLYQLEQMQVQRLYQLEQTQVQMICQLVE